MLTLVKDKVDNLMDLVDKDLIGYAERKPFRKKIVYMSSKYNMQIINIPWGLN